MVATKVKSTLPYRGNEINPKKVGLLELEDLSEDEYTQGTIDDCESDLSGRSGRFFAGVKNPLEGRSSMTKRSNSIIRPDPETSKYISFQRRSWISLPVPNKAAVERSQSLPPRPAVSPTTRKRSKSLRFGQVHFRNFDQTLGDHPSTSYGPPISLDWNFEDGKSELLDSYEKDRHAARRPMKQLMLNYYQRKNILMWQYGYSEAELMKATKQSEKAAFQRSVTKYFLPVSKVEEALQSAGRKAKRAVGLKKNEKTDAPAVKSAGVPKQSTPVTSAESSKIATRSSTKATAPKRPVSVPTRTTPRIAITMSDSSDETEC